MNKINSNNSLERILSGIALAEKSERRSDELEEMLDDLIDHLPQQNGIERRWSFLLGELADTNLHLKLYYKEIAGLS